MKRGWRAVVQAGDKERLGELDMALWTYDDAGFLPHGTAEDGHSARQPVYLTQQTDNPNGAAIRFLTHGAEAGEIGGYERVVYLFEAADPAAMDWARAEWKRLRGEGADITYWRQDPSGRWAKQG